MSDGGDFSVEIGRRGFQRKVRKEVDAKGAKFLDRIHRIDRIFAPRIARIETDCFYYGRRGNQRKKTKQPTPPVPHAPEVHHIATTTHFDHAKSGRGQRGEVQAPRRLMSLAAF